MRTLFEKNYSAVQITSDSSEQVQMFPIMKFPSQKYLYEKLSPVNL